MYFNKLCVNAAREYSDEWSPITLTLVEYPRGDNLGHILAWISLSPLALGVGFISLILFRRDLHTITFFIGIILNEFINKVLKNWIQEPRPIVNSNSFGEYGMPSSHSQFISFFALYIIFFMFLRQRLSVYSKIARAVTVTSLLMLTLLVPYSRIYLCYHTFSQVVVGSLIGGLNGILWFFLTHLVLCPMFPHVVSWKISEFFLLRDTTLIPNIFWFEYAIIRQEVRARSRKVKNKQLH